MALENESGGMVMPVAPMGGYGGGYGGIGGGYDGGLFWIIILFLFMFSGYGNGWGGFGGNGGGTTVVANDVQRGFDQSAVMNGLAGINTSVANGFANAEISRCNNTANLSNQIASNAMTLQSNCYQLQSAIADTKSSVLSENCEDRYQAAQNTRDIIEAVNIGNQRIMDRINQQEIDALKSQNSALQTQLNIAALQGSQTAQTAQIMADNAQQTAELISRIVPTPIPSYPASNLYGYANGYCGCGNGYGCNCNG